MNPFFSTALASLFLLGAASPLTARQTLIPAGAEWKYWLRTSELPSGWTAPELNDERWVTGRAELGYGDGDEATVLAPAGGEPLGSAAIYFRKSFTVNDPSIILGLALRLLRDDGAVVFLNGVEIHRDNMPAGPVLATSMATAAVSTAYEKFNGRTRTDLWLMLGDNAYDTGTDAEYQAAVFDMYPAMLRQSVLWPTIGNHDTAQSTNPSPTLPYFEMFTLPTRAEAGGVPSGTEKYYSFDYANIHFVCLDSMTSSRAADGAMATWLQNDLASTNQPWIIAFWHHPPYTKGSHDSDKERELIEMREKLLPLLEAGGVDLVMTGHSHSYERSYLLNGHYGASTTLTPEMKIDGGTGSATGDGPYRKPGDNAPFKGAIYITAGSSGQISGGPLNHPAMCVSLNHLGSMVLDVNGPRLEARFLRENATVVDSFVIEKSQAAQ